MQVLLLKFLFVVKFNFWFVYVLVDLNKFSYALVLVNSPPTSTPF